MKIKQIIKADPEWIVLYSVDEMYHWSPIPAFALLDNGEVVPMLPGVHGSLVPIVTIDVQMFHLARMHLEQLKPELIDKYQDLVRYARRWHPLV